LDGEPFKSVTYYQHLIGQDLKLTTVINRGYWFRAHA